MRRMYYTLKRSSRGGGAKTHSLPKLWFKHKHPSEDQYAYEGGGGGGYIWRNNEVGT